MGNEINQAIIERKVCLTKFELRDHWLNLFFLGGVSQVRIEQ